MHARHLLATPLALSLFLGACATDGGGSRNAGLAPGTALGADPEQTAAWVEANYEKREVMIEMRDGVALHTTIYTPRKADADGYPIMMHRTPYSSQPYGDGEYPTRLRPHADYWEEGYIFVSQDVRGRFMSEGEFINMTPHASASGINESTDTYDSIEWLLQNVEGHNGRVGMTGISYPGFYSAASMIDHHPALVAVSPQAPIADWWYDDFHHHGALFLPHGFNFLTLFDRPHPEPFSEWPSRRFEFPTRDGYDFFLTEANPLENLRSDTYAGTELGFWNNIIAHPNRDEFWTSRDILPHLHDVSPNVLTVGGWFDAEDLYGPLRIYETIEKNNPTSNNRLVMGPWRHGGWARGDGSALGDQYFGEGINDYYRELIEQPWFRHHLKGEGDAPELGEAVIFETGVNRWHRFPDWPPTQLVQRSLFMTEAGGLTTKPPLTTDTSDSFVSDPAKPVPNSTYINIGMDARYMTEDQRFASRRPDVLVYQTQPLEQDLTIAGPLTAELFVSTTGTAADWIVKLIDVQPGSTEDTPATREGSRDAGAHLMVRSEAIRGRFRNDPANPEPFVPGEVTKIELPLQDVLHTFKKGHRVMVHIQSTWFPMVDRSPQKYLDNPYLAQPEDFEAHTHRVHRAATAASRIRFGELPQRVLDRTADPRFTPEFKPAEDN